MAAPYGLCADLHAHNWTAFASLDAEGRNTRLMAIVRELDRCCQAVVDAYGTTVVIAGDVFHVRGKVEPSVFNPVRDCLLKWRQRGIIFLGIPGNHDCEGREAKRLTSSVAMLEEGVDILFVHQPELVGSLLLIPYVGGPKETLAAVEQAIATVLHYAVIDPGSLDVIIHCGIDGTLSHMPPHGLTAEKLADYGFRRVFAGDYHHHRDFGNGVYSIGATTHQTWGCVGTKAGFLLVYPDRVEFRASHAPSFIDLTGEEDPAEVPLLADGNFVRARIGTASVAQVAEMRQALLDAGAKGVVIQAIPESTASRRAGVSVKSLAALDKSVTDYISERGMAPEVATICADILGEVRAS